MVRIGAITPDQRDTSLSASFQQRKKLGTVLVETGLITPKQLVAGVKHQVWQITSSIFNMFGGCYIFDESPLPDIIPIRLDTVKLIFDSIQKIEWDVVRRSFPVSTLKSVINAVDISTCIFAEKLEKDQQVILSLADGTKSIEVLCNTSKLGDYNALKAVYVLLALKRATVCDPNMPATQKT